MFLKSVLGSAVPCRPNKLEIEARIQRGEKVRERERRERAERDWGGSILCFVSSVREATVSSCRSRTMAQRPENRAFAVCRTTTKLCILFFGYLVNTEKWHYTTLQILLLIWILMSRISYSLFMWKKECPYSGLRDTRSAPLSMESTFKVSGIFRRVPTKDADASSSPTPSSANGLVCCSSGSALQRCASPPYTDSCLHSPPPPGRGHFMCVAMETGTRLCLSVCLTGASHSECDCLPGRQSADPHTCRHSHRVPCLLNTRLSFGLRVLCRLPASVCREVDLCTRGSFISCIAPD